MNHAGTKNSRHMIRPSWTKDPILLVPAIYTGLYLVLIALTFTNAMSRASALGDNIILFLNPIVYMVAFLASSPSAASNLGWICAGALASYLICVAVTFIIYSLAKVSKYLLLFPAAGLIFWGWTIFQYA